MEVQGGREGGKEGEGTDPEGGREGGGSEREGGERREGVCHMWKEES